MKKDATVSREEYDALLGELIADSFIRDALLISLMEVIPDLDSRIEAKVAVMGHGIRTTLSEEALGSLDSRLHDVRALMRDSRTP